MRKRKRLTHALSTLLLVSFALGLNSCSDNSIVRVRDISFLKQEWRFHKADSSVFQSIKYDDNHWGIVSVPHDWAIYGPFDSLNDAQTKQVVADLEKKPKLRLGRTAGLPYMGVGWYRNTFSIEHPVDNRRFFIEFDGAMSNAEVFINGHYVGAWPYGYTSFSFEITEKIMPGENLIAVRLENKPESSRWYPGAGLYRNVRLVSTAETYIKKWGTYITTPEVDKEKASVNIKTSVSAIDTFSLRTDVYSPAGKLIATQKSDTILPGEQVVEQHITIETPELWSVNTPLIYMVISKVSVNEKVIDRYRSTFGIRSFKFTADDGFHLNGKRVQIQGVCMHHDQGPLGAAVNKSALHRQLRILKEMGCNAIRTAHNPPTPELLDMCDTMGFIVMDEAFDEWKIAKNKNGYTQYFDAWAEKDLVALILRDRNHPSVFMWSVGNEILGQFTDTGWVTAKKLVAIAHREDSTRPVTVGMNRKTPAENKFAEQFDLKGWNYHTHLYPELKAENPDWKFIASETQSTVASRGYFDLNAIPRKHFQRENLQCSDYALDYCNWSNTPDIGFAMLDDNPHVAGEFVWTGFDYLGEPTPYNLQWPTKNSYLGIVDLCGFPKSSYYLYKARWTDEDVLHVLPHWNWDTKTVETVPIHVFTSFDSAELFVNGVSQGKRTKNPDKVYERYRLIWDSVPYSPGELKVVAEEEGNLTETEIHTAENPDRIQLLTDYPSIPANGESLAFIELNILDKNGYFCPIADNQINFLIQGPGKIIATANGNSADITSFQSHKRKCFNGKCLLVVQSTTKPGKIKIIAQSEGLKTAEIKIETHKNIP